MADDLSFERACSRIDEIVELLDHGQLTLDQSLGLYEEAVELVRHCNAILDSAEVRLSRLSVDLDGNVGTAELDADTRADLLRGPTPATSGSV